jgi:ribonuclease J
MKITIHRGTQEVGGSCVEICSGNTCILLDFGLPISFEFGDDIEAVLPEPIYSDIIAGKKKIDGLLLSHAHLDHFGLVEKLPKSIPVFLGKATYELIKFNDKFTPNKTKILNHNFIENEVPLSIGDLQITPFQMDHSAFDTFAFHISDGNKSVFYTGDFRGHGLNRDLFEKLITSPPVSDVLLMEGTIIGERQEEIFVTEIEIKQQLVDICKKTEGAVFVSAPSQNVDRMISLSQAAIETGRKFIIDLYSAELFDRLKAFSDRIPQPKMNHVLLWYPWFQREKLFENNLQWVMPKHRQWKHRLKEISHHIPNSIFLIRPPFRKEIERHADLSDSIWIYSMWMGYLKRSKPLQKLKNWTEKNGIEFKFVHTGGHAKLSDLKRLAEAISPPFLIPIHSFHAEQFERHFQNVKMIEDNEVFKI